MKAAHIATWVAALLLAGCAQGGLGGLLGAAPAAQGQPQVSYAAVARAKVYSAPDATSPVQGLLTLHEKITRYQSEAGFAYVEAAGNLSGWVREGELVAARPRAATPTPTPAQPEQPADDAQAAQPPPEVPPGEEEPQEPPAPEGEPERSVFDPY